MSLNAFDRLALADLVHLYASAVDDRRFGDVVELFTETAELRLPERFSWAEKNHSEINTGLSAKRRIPSKK